MKRQCLLVFAVSLFLSLISTSVLAKEKPNAKPNPKAKATVAVPAKLKNKTQALKAPAKEVASTTKAKDKTLGSYLHPAAKQESWYVSGLVRTDQGESYGYYFVVVRQEENFDAYVLVVDLKTGTEVLKEHTQQKIPLAERQGINLKVGNAFLRNNDINGSWVFGIDSKHGVNLRVESLKWDKLKVNHLGSLSFYSLQSKRVNGQLTVGDKSFFVTSRNAWLVHQWGDHIEQSLSLQRVLCRFNDNQGLMLVRGFKHDKVIFDYALLLDADGGSLPVSQFSLVSQSSPKIWQVRLLSPKMQFKVRTREPFKLVEKYHVTDFYSGRVDLSKKDGSGFCMISKDNQH